MMNSERFVHNKGNITLQTNVMPKGRESDNWLHFEDAGDQHIGVRITDEKVANRIFELLRFYVPSDKVPPVVIDNFWQGDVCVSLVKHITPNPGDVNDWELQLHERNSSEDPVILQMENEPLASQAFNAMRNGGVYSPRRAE